MPKKATVSIGQPGWADKARQSNPKPMNESAIIHSNHFMVVPFLNTGKTDGDACAFAYITFDADLPLMKMDQFFHNGQPQTRTSRVPRSGLFHPVKPVKDSLKRIRRDPLSRIPIIRLYSFGHQGRAYSQIYNLYT